MYIINFISAGILRLLSLLPFWFVYIKSDFLFLIIYYIVGYRKKVVYQNLRNSFPEKSSWEIRQIAKKFYHNLSDVIWEQIKLRGMSNEQSQKRMVFKNTDILDKLNKKNKSVIGLIGHTGNWEWVCIFSKMVMPYPTFALYKPLSNKFFNKYLLRVRTKFGLKMISSQHAMRHFINNKNELTFTFMAADQTPIESEIQYWTNFLNQNTPVFTGAEKIARSLDLAVVYVDVKRIKRGYFEANIVELCDDAASSKENEITEKYMRLLEKSIIEQPDNWLWSHRRWKHKRTK
ncbi:MAG: lysophospholipid acyltransferase family protein [Bacteroidales bacterium]|nr:lysophospholipid acyltransferase family protein [Bacteroidales bacterium]